MPAAAAGQHGLYAGSGPKRTETAVHRFTKLQAAPERHVTGDA